MRWIHAAREDELKAKRELIAQIDAWWQAFAAHADQIGAMFSDGAEFDIVGFMDRELSERTGLEFWEFGPARQGDGHRLCIVPSGELSKGPVIEEAIARAPKLEGWEYYPHLLRETPDQALRNVQGRTGIDLKECEVEITCFGASFILTYHLPPALADDNEKALGAAIIASEYLLGEDVASDWVCSIDVAAGTPVTTISADEPSFAVAAPNLAAAIDDLIAERRAELPDKPWWKTITPDSQCVLIEFNSEERTPRMFGDALLGTSLLPHYLEECWNGINVKAFSVCDEQFVVLQITRSETWLNEHISGIRFDLEEAIDAALRLNACGCICAGATGIDHIYIDLALTDLDVALPILRDWAREQSLPHATWLRFRDPALRKEWIGLVDDALAPRDLGE